MKVLFVSRKYPPSIGGMQRLSYHLITQMKERVQASVITWGGSQKALPFFVLYSLAKSVLFGALGIELVHIGDPVLAPVGCVMKGLFRIPVIVTAHGLDITFPVPLYQWSVSRLLRRLDRVVCISRGTYRACIERGIPAEKCIVIYPGTSIPETIPSREESRAWIERRLGQSLREASVLLTVGRLVPRKGVRWFIESVLPRLLSADANVCYVIVGDGPDEERVRASVSRLSLDTRVHLLGQVPEKDLSRAYRAADLFIMPNVRQQGDMEGFGLVALEAGAHGLPVLAADLEGIRDAIVPGRMGHLLRAEDADLWTASLLEFIADPVRLQNLALSAHATVKECFGWTHMVDAYESLFQEVLRQRVREA